MYAVSGTEWQRNKIEQGYSAYTNVDLYMCMKLCRQNSEERK